ncbi:2TM domain-containing protein [Eudoraea chungangensis]|uniref:2TM domain-containing protein n=1 Tax=Eudoraea chungangensis TaxID=1481905 RepID=UPI0023ED80D9|nr:2TM domain-containing protein [Eudoraea chungangensis]
MRKSEVKIDKSQHELLEYAQKRLKQKKALFVHFVFFLIGAVFFVLINKVLNYGQEYDWYLWAVIIWTFILIIHAVDVYFFKRFMGTEWERRQRELLVAKQRKRISEIQEETDKDFPLSRYSKKD